ncbi:hypothetical protein GCM10007881_23730 [Mesorhizobium huakuii]|nr:hypothetical protein GCM10007881_23730 [Mesorhizobium huakuii]
MTWLGPPAARATEPPPTAPSAVADRKDQFLTAVKAAQEALAKAVQGNDLAAAEIAARQVRDALAAYDGEPTKDEIVTRSKDLGDQLGKYRGDVDQGVLDALSGLAHQIALYRAEPTAAELVTRIDDLSAWLDAYKGTAGGAVATAVDKLVASIAIYRGIGRPDLIAKASTELSAWIGKTNWLADDDASAMLGLSETIIQKARLFDPDDAATSFKNMAAAMTAAEGTQSKPSPFRPPLERSVYTLQMKQAWAPLDAQVRAVSPVAWFAAQTKAITDLIGDTDAASLPMRTLLQNDAEAMKAAGAAKDSIVLLQGGYRPQIHIIDALYGDLPTGRNSKRVCNATRGMVARCERLGSCTLDPNYKTGLCGYDPIPAADERTRAVAVQYSCFTGGDDIWDQLASHPLEDPFNFSDISNLSNPATSVTILRGTVMELRCPFDTKTQTMVK